MSFRTLEITNPTEIHIKNNQLELTQENRQIYIPIEDLSMITTIGSNIRLSTMDLSILANNHVSLTTLDNKYSPTALVLPFEGNSRQSQLIHHESIKSSILAGMSRSRKDWNICTADEKGRHRLVGILSRKRLFSVLS